MAQHNLVGYVLRGGGVMPRLRALPALAALTPPGALLALTALTLLALAALTLSPAGAQAPVAVPPGLEFQLQLVDDSDNIVQADSTISVNARLRLEPRSELLRIASGTLQMSGWHRWEANDRSRLAVGAQGLLPAIEAGGEITAYTNAGLTNPLGNGQMLRVLAWDGDTIAGRAGPGNSGDNHIYVFRASTGGQVGRIGEPGPRSAGNTPCLAPRYGYCIVDNTNPARTAGWGRGSNDHTGSAVAVWQEDEDTAWLFAGSSYTNIDSGVHALRQGGALYIYEIDYSGASATVTQRRVIYAPANDLRSRGTWIGNDDSNMAYYGAAVAISADGSTLAVGARRMHDVGAVYVYTRPSGGWGAALGWNDAVRVSPVVIPAWGSANAPSQRPFEPQSSTDGDGGSECDAYCRSVSSYIGDVDERNMIGPAEFGAYVALSADGSVLAVSAPRKRFASDRTAGLERFRGGLSLASHGELLVFLEPAGGWSAVPNYKTGRSEIGYNGSAANFDPDDHYNTGPDKRVNAPDWSFSFDWSDTQNHWLGERLALSPDGTTLAASDRHNDAVQMFQVDSPGGWASGPSAPSATLTGVEDGGRWGGFGFSSDGARFALTDPTHSSNQGRLLLYRRPADGSWADAGAADANEWLAPMEPTDRRVANGLYGRSLAWNLNDRTGLAVGAGEAENLGGNSIGPGRLWTLAMLPDCYGEESRTTVVDGVTYCHLDLNLGSDSSIVIPAGTPDGAFTISGNVSVVYGADTEGESLSVQRRATLEVQIGDVLEVAELKLERATDDRGTAATEDDVLFPDQVARGETTTLLVQVLNENGKAAGTNSVNLVSVQTTVGELSTSIGGSCRGGNGTKSCIIEGSSLTGGNSDKILVTLRHAGTAGTASVTARAISRQGEQAAAGPLSIALTGAPTALNIAAPGSGLLGVDTTDAAADVDERDVDNRDQLTLAVTATDERGAKVAVPTGGSQRAWLTGPDGSRVTEGVAISYPLLDSEGEPALDAERNRQVRVNVNRAATQALANGEYTLTVRAGGLTAERTIVVSGAAAAVALSEPSPAPQIRQSFTVVATVTDANGAAVPNGTSVHWDERTIGDETTMLVQTSQQSTTTDGTAEASYLIVSPGAAVVTVTADGARTSAGGVAGGVSNVIRIAVADPAAAAAAAQPVRLADQLSATTPGAPTSWLGVASVTASALLDALDGVNRILLWQYGRWLSYAVVDGREIPGSYDFVAQPGAVLWLAE